MDNLWFIGKWIIIQEKRIGKIIGILQFYLLEYNTKSSTEAYLVGVNDFMTQVLYNIYFLGVKNLYYIVKNQFDSG